MQHRDAKPSLRDLACNLSRSGERVPVGQHACEGMDPLIEDARTELAATTDPTETVARLNRFFFQAEKFQIAYDLSSVDHLLPERVVSGKKGYCVGLATVYLILDEELKLPIHAVATPNHLFLRWDDGRHKQNIELFQEGRSIPDEEYAREQMIPKESIERGVFLANLSSKELVGFIYQNMGGLESEMQSFESSLRLYKKALHLNPKLPAVWYNRGNDALHQKHYQKAIRAYGKSLRLYPADPWALQNRGFAWKKLGKTEKAHKDWQSARKIDPTLPVPPPD